ncbi:hypothetical protein [Chromobacterium violaceum]|uniref:hypothetical protein n=1 Tax=Chromobacterium violaceum TaxID=536 RepID=UPI001B3414DA|nr:hypothetical protein [Chromobacterium violaceum]MBP4045094.1 hypothetical protein [Chromobacterium violaceum]
MLNMLTMRSKSCCFILFAIFITVSGIAQSSENSPSAVKLDTHYTVLFDYKKNNSKDVILVKNGKKIGKLSFPIPKGRDPRIIGMDSYNRVIFSQPIKTKGGYAIPYLFPLRTNSGGAQGQCGSGVEIWLKIISVKNDSILVGRDELVQSCQHDIYLQDSGDGKIENAFQLENGKIIIKWLSHPSHNGDGYSEAISLD